jgi:quercetin dioxygenase-like cupin family protein
MSKPLSLPRFSLARFPLHLGLGARAVAEPEFTGMAWYDGYVERHAADGDEGRLVQLYSFSESWTSWERHPAGDEAVICTEGEIVLIQELPDGLHKVTLGVGDYAVNPRGVWHTADVTGRATALFITAGRGTEHRPR